MKIPLRSLSKRWRQMMSKIPAAIKKFPQTKVLGNNNSTAAIIVIVPFTGDFGYRDHTIPRRIDRFE